MEIVYSKADWRKAAAYRLLSRGKISRKVAEEILCERCGMTRFKAEQAVGHWVMWLPNHNKSLRCQSWRDRYAG